MAITIRNKETEELIRKIGRRTGEGPSAVVRRLAQAEAANESGDVSKEEVERRLKVFADLRKRYPPPDPKPSWKEINAEIDALYDYFEDESDGEPVKMPTRAAE